MQRYVKIEMYIVLPPDATDDKAKAVLTDARRLIPSNGFYGLNVVGSARLVTDDELVNELEDNNEAAHLLREFITTTMTPEQAIEWYHKATAVVEGLDNG